MEVNADVSMTIIENNCNNDDAEQYDGMTKTCSIQQQSNANDHRNHQNQRQKMNSWKIYFHMPSRRILMSIIIVIVIIISLSLLAFILNYLFSNNNKWPNRLMRFKYKHNHHHTNNELYEMLDSYSKFYPKLTRLYTIGYSNRNNAIKVLEISDKPGEHEPGEAEIKLIGNIHGNEVVGRELLLHLIDHLLSTYHTDSFTRSLVDNLRIHIAPTINPDGYEDSVEGDCFGVKGRFNANGKDLNRNFPDQFITNSNNKVQEKETEILMKWIKSYPFVLSASLHGGALVVNYPFDNNGEMLKNETKSPDDDVFRYLSLVYAKSHPFMYANNGRCLDSCSVDDPDDYFLNGITNGAKWYPVAGGMQDYNYLHTNCLELTIELGCKKYPLSNELEMYWQQNKDALLNLINSTYVGVHGFVHDIKGQALNATIISVNGIDKNVTTFTMGDYWRLLAPGKQYRITASKNGYHSQTFTVLVENSHQLNFTLNEII